MTSVSFFCPVDVLIVTYSIAVFVKDSEENNQANSKIIADISRIVYEYVMQH